MFRRAVSTLLPLLFVASLHAQPYPPGVTLGPARPVAELHRGGDTLDDYLLGVVPDGDGFRAYYYFGRGSDNGHTVHLGLDGQTDFASDRAAFASTSEKNYFVARTTGEGTMLFWIDASRNVRVSPAAADGTALNPSGTLLAPDASYLKAGCNSSRCLVQSWHQSVEGPGDDEIINTAGDVVARISPPIPNRSSCRSKS